jgi:hypothetical protein
MKLRYRPVFLATMSLFAIATVVAEDKKIDDSPSYWMRKKLEYSSRILAGLASADFEEIGQSARSMNVLTRLEKWVHASLPDYRAQLKTFQAANERIIHAADKEDLDGAAAGFLQLTTSCVNCHKVVRDAQRSGESRSQK